MLIFSDEDGDVDADDDDNNRDSPVRFFLTTKVA